MMKNCRNHTCPVSDAFSGTRISWLFFFTTVLVAGCQSIDGPGGRAFYGKSAEATVVHSQATKYLSAKAPTLDFEEARKSSGSGVMPDRPTKSDIVQTAYSQPATASEPSDGAMALEAASNQATVEARTTLTLDATVRYTLERNPQLAAIRQQRGIASAGVVLAKIYPFNPIYQGTFLHAKNNEPGAVTNSLLNGHQVTLEIQLFHQQKFRQQAAFAALSRTDWEIAAQELLFSVNSIRAFDGFLYRQAKLAVTEEFVRLNQKSVELVKQLVDRGTLKSGDLILARAELNDIQSQLGLNRTSLITARRDYYRALGIAEGNVEPSGTLERTAPTGASEHFLAAAFELRPDRFARLAAVQEAEAATRFQKADRFGNPQIGPIYEYSESRTNFLGARIQFPIPIINCKPGEILQAQAKQTQALLFVRQTEVEIRQDVILAAARMEEARKWIDNYRTEILPSLRKSLEDIDQLFKQGQPGVDVLRVLDVRRKLLRAQDGYFDALLIYTSALADFAQAVGDPTLATGGYTAAPGVQLGLPK